METPGLANSEPIRNVCDYAAANPQKLTILFLDEMEQMTPCTVFAALSILTGRQIGYAKFPDNLRTMASVYSKESLVYFGLSNAIIRQFVLYSVEPD